MHNISVSLLPDSKTFKDVICLPPDNLQSIDTTESNPAFSPVENITGTSELTSPEFHSINKLSNSVPSEMSANKHTYKRSEHQNSVQATTARASESEYSPLSPTTQFYRFGDYASPSIGSASFISTETNAPLSAVNPGPVDPTETQLGLAYGYAIRREDGTYTRLIRADELDVYDRVPVSQGPEGLIILPPTRQLSPRRRRGPDVMISQSVLQSLPSINDRRRTVSAAQEPDATQIQIDSIVQRSVNPSSAVTTPARPSRREKIYCDKWIHEGVCAFTQMGCRYLHEMPKNKATQLSLGLNHGLPAWYRRANALDLRPAELTAPAAIIGAAAATSDHTRLAGPWRRSDTAERPTLSFNSRGHSSSFGPIAPPRQAMRSTSPSFNPFEMLPSGPNNGEDDEEETSTWQGRGR